MGFSFGGNTPIAKQPTTAVVIPSCSCISPVFGLECNTRDSGRNTFSCKCSKVHSNVPCTWDYPFQRLSPNFSNTSRMPGLMCSLCFPYTVSWVKCSFRTVRWRWTMGNHTCPSVLAWVMSKHDRRGMKGSAHSTVVSGLLATVSWVKGINCSNV